jgi:hypothetical protein
MAKQRLSDAARISEEDSKWERFRKSRGLTKADMRRMEINGKRKPDVQRLRDKEDSIVPHLAGIPANTVAAIAASLPADWDPLQAITRAYELLELATVAQNSLAAGNALEHSLEDCQNLIGSRKRLSNWKKLVREKIPLIRPTIDGGPFAESSYGYEDVLRNLVSTVDNQLDRENRFAEWLAYRRGIDIKEANRQLIHWRTAGTIPGEVYIEARENWIPWWEAKLSETRRLARAVDTISEETPAAPAQDKEQPSKKARGSKDSKATRKTKTRKNKEPAIKKR